MMWRALALAALAVTAAWPAAAAANHGYVTNAGDDTVSVLDTETNQDLGEIRVGGFPVAIAISPDFSEAWTANWEGDSVTVIDAEENVRVPPELPVGDSPSSLAFTPDGAGVFVTNFGDDDVTAVNASSGTPLPLDIPVGDGPEAIAINAGGTRAYVANFYDGTVSVIDLVARSPEATIPVGQGPRAIAITSDGSRAYVANAVAGTVSAIDLDSETVAAAIPVGAYPNGLAVGPDGKSVYATLAGADAVAVIDVSSNTLSGNLAAGNVPRSVGLTPQGSFLYAANEFGGAVTVADLSGGPGETITVGSLPTAVAIVQHVSPIPINPPLIPLEPPIEPLTHPKPRFTLRGRSPQRSPARTAFRVECQNDPCDLVVRASVRIFTHDSLAEGTSYRLAPIRTQLAEDSTERLAFVPAIRLADRIAEDLADRGEAAVWIRGFASFREGGDVKQVVRKRLVRIGR